MRHNQQHRKLNRTRRGRAALLRGLAVSLITRDRIVTTTAKAKEAQPFVERLITFGKSGTIADRRKVASLLGNPTDEVVKKVFDNLAPRYKERSGGYTRIIKLGTTSPGKTEAVIEFV